MKLASVLQRTSLVLVAALAIGGCALEPASEAPAGDDTTDKAADVAQRIAELKQHIAAISLANQTREDNFAEVSDELWPYVEELTALAPERTDEETLAYLVGSWWQLWSNLEDMGPGFIKMNRAEIYQVVSPYNYYYNFGESKVAGLFKTTGVLRGAYALGELGASSFDIEFTNVGFLLGGLRPNPELISLAHDIEAGDQEMGSFGSGQAPKGPVGITGTLTTLYVDDEIRIAGGSQDTFVDDESGEIVEGREQLLFVLVRAQ